MNVKKQETVDATQTEAGEFLIVLNVLIMAFVLGDYFV
jgi:hypothetical protein